MKRSLPEWLKVAVTVVFLCCMTVATVVYLTDEYERKSSERQQLSASPSAQSSESESNRVELERREHAANEYWLTAYTGDLARFTLLLAAIAVLQAGLFVWQLVLMNRGVNDAKDAAVAAKAGAQAALLQARVLTAAVVGDLMMGRLDLLPYPDLPLVLT
jgi:hypothetical protein